MSTTTPAGSVTPDSTNGSEPTDRKPNLGNGLQLGALIGLAGLVGSILTTWGKESMWDKDRSAMELTSQFLWDTTPADLESSPIMWLLLAAGLVVVVGLWRSEVRWMIAVGGLAVIAVPLLYMRAVNNILNDFDYGMEGGVTSHLGMGVWIGLVAGVALTAVGVAAIKNR